MATYKVNYYIKRNCKMYEASRFVEAESGKEAIEATRDYAKKNHLPHPFRPKARKETSFELSSVNWKKDTITGNFRRDNAGELLHPEKMKASRLATALTYCETNENPYAEELMRRAGNLATFKATIDQRKRGEILRNAAKSFGIVLF